MRLGAARNGQLVAFGSLATDLGVSPNTVKSWLSVLEASAVVLVLDPYFENLGKRIVKTPEEYFLDTGLCSYLLGARTPEGLVRSPMLGAIFETHVLGQMVRHYANQGRRREIYYYRDHHSREVGFLIPSAGRFAPIECKWAESAGPGHRGFSELESLAGRERITSKTFVTPERRSRQVVGASPSPTASPWISSPVSDGAGAGAHGSALVGLNDPGLLPPAAWR